MPLPTLVTKNRNPSMWPSSLGITLVTSGWFIYPCIRQSLYDSRHCCFSLGDKRQFYLPPSHKRIGPRALKIRLLFDFKLSGDALCVARGILFSYFVVYLNMATGVNSTAWPR